MNYVADFETFVPDDKTLDKLDRKKYPNDYLRKEEVETYVWGYGIVEVGKIAEEDIVLGNSIESFMEHCMTLNNPIIYFHNLKFDGHFILAWAFKNGYIHSEKKKEKTFNVIISKMNMFYKIELIIKRKKKGYKKITFYDSLKKLPFSVDRIGSGFKLDHHKMEVPEDFYKIYRSKNHELTELEKEYIRDDIRVVSQALQIQFSQGLTKMTNGSDALDEYKAVVSTKQFERWFPVLSFEMNEMIRLAYRGGYTYASDLFRNKLIAMGLVFDVNSLYPAQMYSKKMPHGEPLFFEGKYVKDDLFDLHIQEFMCEFKLKENHLPTIQIKGDLGRYSPTDYLHESKGLTKLHLTDIDLKLFFDHYDVYNIEWLCGLKFRSNLDMFKTYIDKWTVIKTTNTGAIRELAKLMLNALYGKFATNPDVTGKFPYFTEDGLVKLVMKEEEFRDSIYTAVGVWTTSYGREVTIRTAQENYHRFAYCDTDSIHIVGDEMPNIEVHPTKLGAWDLEGKFNWARFIGAKCYAEEFSSEFEENSGRFKGRSGKELSVTVAGMTPPQKKFVTKENFAEGLILGGKLMPMIVNGGIVLVDRTFELKVRNFG